MAQAPGMLQERRSEEDRTLSPGLARCCQLCERVARQRESAWENLTPGVFPISKAP